MRRELATLSVLARLGFTELGQVVPRLDRLEQATGVDPTELLTQFGELANPDAALVALLDLAERHPAHLVPVLGEEAWSQRLLRVLGASSGLAEFVLRHPEELPALQHYAEGRPDVDALYASLLESVGAVNGVASMTGDPARVALRVRYRHHLLRLAAWDLGQADPLAALKSVTEILADLAGAALEASLAIARADVATKGNGPVVFAAEDVAQVELAVIGMGKAGARELNYVSDVDVIFVGQAAEGAEISDERAMTIATKLAMLTMRGLYEIAIEPPLWEVDANLRPEGKAGALVRTLDSHISYYQRWAKDWEFQALLKARPMAGSRALGEAYVAGTQPMVWSSASRESFVEQVQRMRGRVTDNIPADEVDRQLKLGPGGLRDIEFTVQLLQLVHGQHDESVHVQGTLVALSALAAGGYIGRAEADEFSQDYRLLRVLEHRLQLQRLSRTHLMPADAESQRILARASRLGATADDLLTRWRRTKNAVRNLHERLFYRPLLSAVARAPEQGLSLTSAQAEARLAAIGFKDARGALAHIASLTSGVSRKAAIQRTLIPVLLQWFADGVDPDGGLLAFRRISDSLGDAHWYLRMLRDSQDAAQRLTQALSASRFVVELLERYPEGARWLESDEELRPRSWETLREETLATVARHADRDSAGQALRSARRREILRVALASIAGTIDVITLGHALSDITTAMLTGVLRSIRRDEGPWPEFGIVAMGRYGGAELGFGSDADIMYVHRPVAGMEPELAQKRAEHIVAEIKRLTSDDRLPLDLDLGLRPEGKNGPVVRSLRSYEAYYQRWSLTWEAQALLRARGVAGDHQLLTDFRILADRVRYPRNIPETEVREIKRIKARVESERLPQGADPTRHLKLGRGTLSDVEWLVQLAQLRHGDSIPALRTPSTLKGLAAAEESGIIGEEDATKLREAWLLSSRLRSAMTLATNRTSDLIPAEVRQLEGIARLLEYPPGSAAVLDEDFLRVTRRSRQVFERLFYGIETRPKPTTA